MKARASHLLPVLIVLFLAALTLWLRFAVEQEPAGEGAKSRHDPDAVVQNLTMNRLDQEGKPKYLLIADRMFHYPDDDSTALESLRFIQRRTGGPDTVVTATRGTITKEGEEAFLYDKVLLVRAASPGREELRVQTDYLHVIAEKELALTDRRVTITQGKSTLVGIGMEVNNRTQVITLRSNVKGSFDAARH